MTTPSRSPNASVRSRKPQRPLPALPAAEGTKRELSRLHLVKDDIHEPFQLLESHPLSLICQYHNVKRVSLEEGVPPPFKFDIPVLRDALDDPNALLPTHVLAVFDQDTSSERTDHSPTLSPHSAGTSASRPATPLMIPVNAELWALYFTSTLSTDPVPSSVPSPSLLAIDAMRRHSRTDSIATTSSQSSNRNSLTRARPRSVLSLPVHVVRVPSAKALPLLLLASMRIRPKNRVMPALLPRKVLAELPAPPAILAQHLSHWLYPTQEDRGRRSLDDVVGHLPFSRPVPIPRIPSRTRSPRLSSSPLLSPSLSPHSDNPKRLSSASVSSLLSTSSSVSSLPSSVSLVSQPVDRIPEPVCVLADPATADDPDLRLLALTQQNFGLWANALALGVRDRGVVRLAELAWSVASEARHIRFGDISVSSFRTGDIDDHTTRSSTDSSLRIRQARSRSRTPVAFLDVTRPDLQSEV